MLVLEAKLKGKEEQYNLVEEAIRAALFCRNKALRYWLDNEKVSGYDLNKQMAVLAKEFDFAKVGQSSKAVQRGKSMVCYL
jgi:putative transposase